MITVDAHLHRTAHLEQAVLAKQALALWAAPLMGELLPKKLDTPFLLGLDAAGVREIWSTDSVSHPSNVISLANLLGDAVGNPLARSAPEPGALRT